MTHLPSSRLHVQRLLSGGATLQLLQWLQRLHLWLQQQHSAMLDPNSMQLPLQLLWDQYLLEPLPELPQELPQELPPELPQELLELLLEPLLLLSSSLPQLELFPLQVEVLVELLEEPLAEVTSAYWREEPSRLALYLLSWEVAEM